MTKRTFRNVRYVMWITWA